jgi:hypothetical protein
VLAATEVNSLSELSDVGTVAHDAGKLLVADGTDLDMVAMSGDATLADDGTLTLTTETATRNVPLTAFHKDNLVTELATAGDATNLGLVAGTHGSASPVLKSSDIGGTTGTETARLLLSVPDDYSTGDLTLTFHAGMQVVADDSATLDCQVYEADGEGGVSADLCETAAQDINSATLSDIAFTIDGDDLAAGDILDVEITVTATDSGNAADNINAIIGSLKVGYTARN